jgi:hypothetical protein
MTNTVTVYILLYGTKMLRNIQINMLGIKSILNLWQRVKEQFPGTDKDFVGNKNP